MKKPRLNNLNNLPIKVDDRVQKLMYLSDLKTSKCKYPLSQLRIHCLSIVSCIYLHLWL